MAKSLTDKEKDSMYLVDNTKCFYSDDVKKAVLEFQKKLDLLHRRVEEIDLTQYDLDWLQENYKEIFGHLK